MLNSLEKITIAENSLSQSGITMEILVLQTATLASCRLNLSTAWVVMHSLYLRHLRETANRSPTHQPWSRISAAFCVWPVYTINRQPLYTYSTYSCSSCLFQCFWQHNCYLLYSGCTCSGCSSWSSFISITFQAHLGASCLRLRWLPEKSKSYVWSTCDLRLWH